MCILMDLNDRVKRNMNLDSVFSYIRLIFHLSPDPSIIFDLSPGVSMEFDLSPGSSIVFDLS